MGDLAAVLAATHLTKGLLGGNTNRDDEFVQSFTRVDIGQDSDEDKGEDGKPVKKKSDHHKKGKKEHKKKGKKGHGKEDKEKKEKKADKDDDKEEEEKKPDDRPPSPRIPAAKSTFAQISKELKARKIAAIQAAAKARKKGKKGQRRQEEIYTDKDRAAAVNLGTRDIKQSLKIKRRQDRSHQLQIPEEAEPGTLLALGNNELRSGDVKIALNFVNKALELNPGDKNGLVARSKCYLLLGEPQLALQDAETALHADKTFIRAIYQKAEALYHLGDFEHSLMYYHRGHRLRPELEIFRLGVQKAQEAIENTIGNAAGLNGPKKVSSTPRHSITTTRLNETSRSEKSSAIITDRRGSCIDTKRSSSTQPSDNPPDLIHRRRSKSAAPTQQRRGSRNLLGELGADRVYLENLLKHPDIVCSNQEATSVIIAQAEEGIAFLKSRQEFWRQQRPNSTPTVKKVKSPTSNFETSSFAEPA